MRCCIGKCEKLRRDARRGKGGVNRIQVSLNMKEPYRVILTRKDTDHEDLSWICTTQGIQTVALCIVRHLAPKVLTADEFDALADQTVRTLQGGDLSNPEAAFGTAEFECKTEQICKWLVPRDNIQGMVDLDETDILVLISDDEPEVALLSHTSHSNILRWRFHRRDLVE